MKNGSFHFFFVWKYPFCVNMILNFKRVSSRRNLVPTLGRLINAPLLLIIFFDFFLPISFQPLPSPTINYWGKFSTQIYLLKQYTHADFFVISQRSVLLCKFVQGSQHFVFCFVSQYKETSLLTIIDLTLQKQSNVCFVFIECVA